MDANILNSVSVLQEFLQTKYIEYNDEYDNYETKLELLKAKCPNYFFQNSNGYVLDSKKHVMYLINKSGLPDDIKEQLVGGSKSKISDYYNQRDVYGVTSDLKVYYCEDGVDTILGLKEGDLQEDNQLEEVYSSDSKLSEFVNGGTKPLTNQDLKKITSLIINKKEDIELLKEFKNLPNLEKVEFVGIDEIDDISGIGDATNLKEVRFEKCFVKNYSDLSRNKNLNKLYLISPKGRQDDITNLCSENLGIGGKDFPNLNYLAVTGRPASIESLDLLTRGGSNGVYYPHIRFGIDSLNGFSGLSNKTKQSIKYLYINNLSLTSLEGFISGFSNLEVLRCEYNNLSNLKGLEDLTKLTYLFACDQFIPGSDSNFGKEEKTNYDGFKDALASIQNLNCLKYVDLSNNSVFKWAKYLKDLSNLEYLNLQGCSGILDFGEISSLVNKLRDNVLYDGVFGVFLINKDSTVLDLRDSTVKVSDFEKLKGATSLFALNLRKTKIVDENGDALTEDNYNEKINEILSSCTGMKYLEISYQGDLNNINFVSKMPDLMELNLIGDNKLTNLSPLEAMSGSNDFKLSVLMLSNPNLQLTNIQKTISKVGDVPVRDGVKLTESLEDDGRTSYWYLNKETLLKDTVSGLVLTDNKLFKQLESCTEIENLVLYPGWRGNFGGRELSSSLDLSGCDKLRLLFFYYYGGRLVLPENLEYCFYGFTKTVNVDFANCKKLRKMETFCLEVNNQFDELFKTLKNNTLEELIIRDQDCSSGNAFSNLEWIKDFKKLKTFAIDQNNDWDSYYWENLDGLKYLDNLEHLEINFTTNRSFSGDFPDLSGLTKLKFLKIQYGNMNLENIKGCKNLTEITINNTYIKNIDFLKEINGLEKVDLSYNQIGDIEGLTGKSRIQTLKLGNNSIVDIAPLKGLINVNYLELNDNKLSDFSYDSNGDVYYTQTILTDLNQNYELRSLYLWGNLYDDYSIVNNDNLEWELLVLNEKDKPKE